MIHKQSGRIPEWAVYMEETPYNRLLVSDGVENSFNCDIVYIVKEATKQKWNPTYSCALTVASFSHLSSGFCLLAVWHAASNQFLIQCAVCNTSNQDWIWGRSGKGATQTVFGKVEQWYGMQQTATFSSKYNTVLFPGWCPAFYCCLLFLTVSHKKRIEEVWKSGWGIPQSSSYRSWA